MSGVAQENRASTSSARTGVLARLVLVILAPLSACDSGPPPPPAKDAPDVAASELADNEVACALDGAERFTSVCTVERMRAGKALHQLVRHPDGGFRRFEVVNDGRGVVPADGAPRAETALNNGMLEVTLDDDAYLFPARLRDHADHP